MPKLTVKPKGKGGQPTKYRPEYGRMAKKACQLGATYEDLADLFGVTSRTVYGWAKKYPVEFFQALKDGQAEIDDSVELSLLQRARGGIKTTEKRVTIDSDGKKTQQVIEREHPADTVACIFWLKNRRPNDWREKNEPEAPKADEMAAQIVAAIKAMEAATSA